MAVKNMNISFKVKKRFWCYPMACIGCFAVYLGACPEKVSAWIVKYGIKIEIIDS